MLDSRWLAPPPSLPPTAARLFAVRTIGPFIGLVMHAAQALVFLWMGLRMLALASVGSVAVFAVAVQLVRAGRSRAAMFISYFEIAIHAAMLTFVLGTETGYLAYYVVLCAAPLLVFGPDETKERTFLVVFALAVAPVVFFVARRQDPFIALSASQIERLAFLNVLGGLIGTLGIMVYFSAATERAEADAARERERSEELLRNVLPEVIADRLKSEPGTIADSFASVTVLFADLVGFTQLASRVDSRAVVDMLNEIFSRFDRLAVSLQLEKIKTIGDAYMVVGGLPVPHDDHVAAVAEMAVRMREELHAFGKEHGAQLDLRIGVHTGPVVAGVIGERKLTYDIWGDTVNTASRMESHSEPGRIQITSAVHAALPAGCQVEHRGIIDVKGKGPMETWYLDALPSAEERRGAGEHHVA